MKINDTVRIVSFTDEEADYPRTDLVGKTGTIVEIYENEYAEVKVGSDFVVLYLYEIEKV